MITTREEFDKATNKGKIWVMNDVCPACGDPSDHKIQSAETGLSYCSNECALKHVNQLFKGCPFQL